MKSSMTRNVKIRILMGFLCYFTISCIVIYGDVKDWFYKKGITRPYIVKMEEDDGVKFAPLDNHEALQHVAKGGEYTPRNVTSRERTAIIVPYRDRAHHRQIFLQHMHSFLRPQNISYRIFFVEMTMPTTFNRGLLINVGFQIAEKMRNFTCFIFHDVDLLPMNDNNRYVCNGSVVHFATEGRKYKYRLPYPRYIGGVIGFPGNLFRKVNGFSNGYFGWGVEDDDLFRRLKIAKMELKRLKNGVGRYYALEHDWDAGNDFNADACDFYFCKTGWQSDGLNSVKYEEISRESLPLYTWILIKVNQTSVMNSIDISQACLYNRNSKLFHKLEYVLAIAIVLALVVSLSPVIQRSKIYAFLCR